MVPFLLRINRWPFGTALVSLHSFFDGRQTVFFFQTLMPMSPLRLIHKSDLLNTWSALYDINSKTSHPLSNTISSSRISKILPHEESTVVHVVAVVVAGFPLICISQRRRRRRLPRWRERIVVVILHHSSFDSVVPSWDF